jgi:hypothetical protein
MLKVLTNEKRSGLTVESFDRSRFKLVMLKFSNKFAKVLYMYCERPKEGQVLFENKQNELLRTFTVYFIQKLFSAIPIPRIRDMMNMMFFS